MILNFKTKHSHGASVQSTEESIHLKIPGIQKKDYCVAQVDDYSELARKNFPHRPSLRLSLHARTSAESLPGTWGFGLWNDPFGLSIGYGGNPFRFPALPNAIWFFHASMENYLSFSENPGNGFLAQVFRAPAFPIGQLAKVGLTLPFSRKIARGVMSEIIEEDGIRLGVDVTEWHKYSFEWSPERSVFWVDENLVLETSVSPRPPLGLVLWIDNQFAAWRPDGKVGFGVLKLTEPAWLEVKDLAVEERQPGVPSTS